MTIKNKYYLLEKVIKYMMHKLFTLNSLSPWYMLLALYNTFEYKFIIQSLTRI